MVFSSFYNGSQKHCISGRYFILHHQLKGALQATRTIHDQLPEFQNIFCYDFKAIIKHYSIYILIPPLISSQPISSLIKELQYSAIDAKLVLCLWVQCSTLMIDTQCLFIL